MSQCVTFQVCQPMAHARQWQGRAEPVARCYTKSKQGADGFFAALNSGKMSIGAARHNTTAQGTAVALHKKSASKSIKITWDKTMAPDHVMVAV